MKLFKELAAFLSSSSSSDNPHSCLSSFKRHIAKKKRDRRDRRGGWTFYAPRSGDSTDEETSEGSGSSDGAKYGDCDDECEMSGGPIPRSIEAGSWDACCRSDLRIPLRRGNLNSPPPSSQQPLRRHPGKLFEPDLSAIDEESSSCCRSSSRASRCPSLVSEEEDRDWLRKEHAAIEEEAERQHSCPSLTSEEEDEERGRSSVEDLDEGHHKFFLGDLTPRPAKEREKVEPRDASTQASSRPLRRPSEGVTEFTGAVVDESASLDDSCILRQLLGGAIVDGSDSSDDSRILHQPTSRSKKLGIGAVVDESSDSCGDRRIVPEPRSKPLADRPPPPCAQHDEGTTNSDDSSRSIISDDDSIDDVDLLCGLVLEQSFRSTYCI